MKFLVDRCAGKKVTDWLNESGHDAKRVRAPDPGDRAILAHAAEQKRILITLDKDFGKLIYLSTKQHSGMIRLPDLPVKKRVKLIDKTIKQYKKQLLEQAIVTISGTKIRISYPPES